jgi:imidazolonepropionase-like amidohydrolase
MKRMAAGLTWLLLMAATWVPAQEPARALALVNATLVDPRDGRVSPGMTVVIREGKFESVGTTAAPAGTEVIDLAGKHLVPGLVDAHVHIQSLRALRTALESGVTTVRSAGVSSYVDVGMRELVRRGDIVGPDVIAAGYHVRPHLAEEAFFDHPALARYMRGGITRSEAIREAVRANLSRGVDWIKVLATERAGTAETDPRIQVYTEDELRAAVEEAAVKNVPVEAHAHGDEGAMAAVRAGVRSIEHGTYLSDATLRLMREKGTYFDPTYTTVVDLTEPGGDYDVPALRVRGQHMLPRLRETVQRAYRLGVKIVTGADTGYGPASLTRISQEVTNFAEMGMKPLDALRAATVVAAEMLRLEEHIGVIAPGFEADAIAVEMSPLASPRALQDVLLVVSNGRVAVNRLEMRSGSDLMHALIPAVSPVHQHLHLEQLEQHLGAGDDTVGLQQGLSFERFEIEILGQGIDEIFVGDVGRELALPPALGHRREHDFLEAIPDRKEPLPVAARNRLDDRLHLGQPVRLRVVPVLLTMNAELGEPAKHDIRAAVRQRLDVGDDSRAADGKHARPGAVFPSRLEKDHSDHPVSRERIGQHLAVAGLENVQGQQHVRKQDDGRQREDRDDRRNHQCMVRVLRLT